jgi:hypothetical protein
MSKKPPALQDPTPLGRRVCGNCCHWERFPDDGHPAEADPPGECLLHPPKVHGFNEEGEPIQSLPVVTYRHRCGDHTRQVN